MSVATDDRDARIAALEEENARLRSAIKAALNMVDGDGHPPDWDTLRAVLEAKP